MHLQLYGKFYFFLLVDAPRTFPIDLQQSFVEISAT